MARLYISYGIPKSASTFAWQLIKRIAIRGGLPIATLTAKSKGRNSLEDYIDPVSEEKLQLVRDEVGDAPVVIKTHGGATPAVIRLVAEGEAMAFASYRDLRDVALSLLDHAARSRMQGIADFAHLHTLQDTLPILETQVQRFEKWIASCAPLLIPYDEICFDTRATITRIADCIGVTVDVESIFAEFAGNKTAIGQFNKGERRRFEREMTHEDSTNIFNQFSEFYRKYMPGEGLMNVTKAPISRKTEMQQREIIRQPLLCVVHIPKTAGSAIRETLVSVLGRDKVYWIGHQRPHAHWENAVGTEFDDYAVVGGHRNAMAFQKIKRPKVFLAVVRDPVKRAISLFNYITQGPDVNHPQRKELQGLSVIEAIEKSSRFRADVENRQCAFIGGERTFGAALRSLCENEWFVDRHESVEELFGRVCERFGWRAEPLGLKNAAQPGYAKEYLSDLTVAALEKINKEDRLLVSIFAEGARRLSASTGQGGAAAAATQSAGAAPSARPAEAVEIEAKLRLERGLTSDREEPAPLPAAPDVVTFTPEQRAWASSLGATTDRLLLAHFRAVPGSRPTIHISGRSQLAIPRVARSVEYIDDLISRYILGTEYFHGHKEFAAANGEERFCILQAGDRTNDIPRTIGYCANSPQVTLIPDLHFWATKGYFSQREAFNKIRLPWDNRARVVFWRGSSTGGDMNVTVDSFAELPRYRLCAAAATGQALFGVLDAKLTNIVQARPDEAAKIRAFVGNQGLLSAYVPQSEFLQYRFQVDIDGNGSAWGLLLKLLMGSCVLKVSSDWRQWYYDAMRPWEHYVPVRRDLSDLEERIGWCLDNDDAAREIGANGLKFATGIVFDTEMPRAAAAILKASRRSIDGVTPEHQANINEQSKSISDGEATNGVYLMTAHGTFVGIDDDLGLIQLDISAENLSRLVCIEKDEGGIFHAATSMADYEVGTCPQGMFFIKNTKYLCAIPNSTKLVADRDVRRRWETFSPVAPQVALNIVNNRRPMKIS